MSTPRRILLLACILAASVSCAHRPVPVRSAVSLTEGPSAIVFEPQLAAATGTPNPYAPIRSAEPAHYSWQSPSHAKCPQASLASGSDRGTVLTFSGSVGVFPPLPEEDPSAARPAEPALDTWGSGDAPTEKRLGSADSVVVGLRPAFRQCFSRWLDSNADARGSVHFSLELGCTGEVQAISADVQGVDEPTLECLFRVVAPAQFEPPAGGHATLRIPVVFKNAADSLPP
jgi:hypothetical protein